MALLRLIEPAVFEHWSGVRDEIERQSREEAEAVLHDLAPVVRAESGAPPEFLIERAEATLDAIRAVIAADLDIKVVVLAAATGGRGPGPLIGTIARSGVNLGGRKVAVTVVPGDLTDEEIADLA